MHQPEDLKRIGLKATVPRMKILEIFNRPDSQHLSADDVYRLLVTENLDIGLATVYRVLTQFEQAGLLTRHHFEAGRAVFELARADHHDHLVCMQCGRVEEFVDPEIEARQERIAQSYGFQLADHALSLYVNCQREHCEHRANGKRVILQGVV